MKRRDFLQSAATLAAVPFIGRAGRGISVAGRASPRIGPLRVDGARLNGWLARFDSIGRTEGGINRVAYSEGDLAGRAFTLDLFREAGLAPRIDAAGNIVGRLAGSDPSLPVILIGSHVDSVTDGGNYDGPVGSFSAIEVTRTLQEQRVRLRHPLEVVVWQNEEGGTWGSHLITAAATPAELANVARSGKSIRDGVAYLGGNPDQLSRSRRMTGDVHGYLELHIEQGGHLDREKLDIGIVEGIVGLREWDVTVEGFANHAGTTPMNERRDAMLAAARFVEAVNRIVLAEPGRQVGTVGRIQAFPGAPNVVPGRVTCTLELRDLDDAKIQRLYDAIRAEADRIGGRNGTSFAFHEFVSHESARCDPRVRQLIAASASELGFKTMSLPSGAGHDAQNLARICPMGMIFIPSVGGISHAPTEFSRPQDITNGANVLLGALRKLDATPLGTSG